MKSQSRKSATLLTVLFTLTYMISYITRINYGAVISEIEAETGFLKSSLSAALTGSFITYGVGQLVSGFFGDRFSPKKLVAAGLVTTVAINIVLPFFTDPVIWTVLWCINGFAQSFMWPPMVKLMAVMLSHEEYNNASAKVSFGANFGTIAVYLLSPLVIITVSWRAVFVISAVFGIIMTVIWCLFLKEPTDIAKNAPVKSNAQKPRIICGVIVAAMTAIALQGMLRDGVTTWMPSYISETYNFSNAAAILTGVILPIFSLVCIQLASKLYIRKFNNPLECGGILFAVGTAAAVILIFATGRSPLLSVIGAALLTGSMHGVNFSLICMIPPYFAKYGTVSTVSGILNACTYIGSAVSSYGIAIFSQSFGWSKTVLLWLIIAVLGTLVCAVAAKSFKKKYM